ncbi:MAG: lytic transglycosylase [Hyphomicrobiales bacterium]|nr:MAG: lytic transglycosylase [Hyphomicrobiales bacterium]
MKVDTSPSIAGRIEQAFATASQTTGTSFDYLLRTAERESSLNPGARASTSSAAGLFQFIESTWLETMKESGAEFGLGKYAAQIQRTRNGSYRVADADMRQEILSLRHDPKVSSYMAAAYTQKNAESLTSQLGRQPSAGELYIAHFLGARGAEKLITLAESAPNASAAAKFPKQASANRSIFYNSNGSARSASDVYAELVSKHQGAATTGEVMTASATNARFSEVFGLMGYTASDDAAARVHAGWSATQSASAFDSLFRTDGSAAEPVSSSGWSGFTAELTAQVARLEGVRGMFSAPSSAPAKPAAVAVSSDGKPLDLTAYLQVNGASKPKDLLPPA